MPPGAVPPWTPPPGPQGYYGGPADPTFGAPPPKRNRFGVVALGALILLVVAIVGGLAVFRDRVTGDVTGLQVGDCIDEPSQTPSVSDVQHQPCNEPHDGEVFANVIHSAAADATYPPGSDFDDLVDRECVPALEAYTARSVEEVFAAGYSYGWFYPLPTGWESGDRGVTCYVVKDDGTKMVGSIRVGGSQGSPSP